MITGNLLNYYYFILFLSLEIEIFIILNSPHHWYVELCCCCRPAVARRVEHVSDGLNLFNPDGFFPPLAAAAAAAARPGARTC